MIRPFPTPAYSLRPATLLVLVLVSLPEGGSSFAGESLARIRWEFHQEKKWNGWTPNAQIRDVRFDDDRVSFRTGGADPQILGPLFELVPASGDQWVEIDIAVERPGEGELFYTNKTTGRYGGLEPRWMSRVVVPSAGRQTVRVWPFWGGLGKIIRLRFDPPSGIRCELRAIAVVEARDKPPTPSWSFEDDSAAGWAALHAARVERSKSAMKVTALGPQAVVITPVAPFDAARRSVLRLDAACPGEPVLGLYWVTREKPGLHGEPLELQGSDGRAPEETDLRQFPTWKGTVTHFGLGFGTRGGETLMVRSVALGENDPGRPFLRLLYLGFRRPLNRAGEPADVRAIFENVGGSRLPRAPFRFSIDGHPLEGQAQLGGPVAPEERLTVESRVRPRRAGRLLVEVNLPIAGQTFSRSLHVDPPLERLDGGARPAERPAPDNPEGYDVPPPRSVRTDYRIGVYYFPGWSADQLSRWQKQEGFFEREPLLGWYEEGRPEVADWHIKWALENGISFFIYDWYWRDGHEELGAALNEGFLKARYRDRLQFALMWANHRPFSSHTREQLLAVTGYWIENYLRRPNYLLLDGKPYVSFFSPGELLVGLGSEEAVGASLDAMRKRARGAGLPGLHVATCSGPDRPGLESLARCGFDSVTAYNYLRTGAATRQSSYRQFVLGHEGIWTASDEARCLPYIPLLTVGWDSRPWHGPRAERRFARRTGDFAEALRQLKAWLDARGRHLAILEAWNEWGEGSYIEPNAEFGFGDLEAIRSVFCDKGGMPANTAPQDLGLEGKYDLRSRSKGSTEER